LILIECYIILQSVLTATYIEFCIGLFTVQDSFTMATKSQNVAYSSDSYFSYISNEAVNNFVITYDLVTLVIKFSETNLEILRFLIIKLFTYCQSKNYENAKKIHDSVSTDTGYVVRKKESLISIKTKVSVPVPNNVYLPARNTTNQQTDIPKQQTDIPKQQTDIPKQQSEFLYEESSKSVNQFHIGDRFLQCDSASRKFDPSTNNNQINIASRTMMQINHLRFFWIEGLEWKGNILFPDVSYTFFSNKPYIQVTVYFDKMIELVMQFLDGVGIVT
jgi:hypothetical protein